jgi:hypothetical protein
VGTGKHHLEQIEPFRLVNLDAAAFDWLWRMTEQKARQHQQEAKERGGIHELQAQVSLHAVLAFREAAGTLNNTPPPGTKVIRRRVVKKS